MAIWICQPAAEAEADGATIKDIDCKSESKSAAAMLETIKGLSMGSRLAESMKEFYVEGKVKGYLHDADSP